MDDTMSFVVLLLLSEATSYRQAHPLRLDVLVDEAVDGGTEGLLLVGSDPNEVPEERCRSRRQC